MSQSKRMHMYAWLQTTFETGLGLARNQAYISWMARASRTKIAASAYETVKTAERNKTAAAAVVATKRGACVSPRASAFHPARVMRAIAGATQTKYRG